MGGGRERKRKRVSVCVCLCGREWERERRERGQHLLVIPLIYAFTDWFLYVPWPAIKPMTLANGDDALTNWATWPRRTRSYYTRDAMLAKIWFPMKRFSDKNANRLLSLLFFLEGMKMQLRLETSKYEIPVTSFINLSNTYIGWSGIFLRTWQIVNHVIFIRTLRS